MNNTETSKTNPLWAFFSSVRLTIVLLIVLALASILGTLIPQRGQGAAQFAKEIGPGMFSFLSTTGLFDMYHAWWFRMLILALALNLIICSIERFSRSWRRFAALPRPDREKPFDNLPETQSFLVKGDAKNIAAGIARFLKSRYRRVQDKSRQGQHFFYGDKGRYSHFGVYMVHLSVLLILCGGLLGSFYGFEAFVNIVEGQRADTAFLTGPDGMKKLKLGFEVQCDRFFVDFYETGAPKEYKSDLSFFVGGRLVEKRSALVNHPVEFRGITFYQASWGVVPGGKIRLSISRAASNSEDVTLEVRPGEQAPLPGAEGLFQVVDVKADFMGTGPAALIRAKKKGGKEALFWIFKNPEAARGRLPEPMLNSPRFNASALGPYTFSLLHMEKAYYTGLQVNRDPGVPVVWSGCFMMIAGFFVTFFMSNRRIWVRLSQGEKGMRVDVAGTANRNPVGLERELENLTGDLEEMLSRKV